MIFALVSSNSIVHLLADFGGGGISGGSGGGLKRGRTLLSPFVHFWLTDLKFLLLLIFIRNSSFIYLAEVFS